MCSGYSSFRSHKQCVSIHNIDAVCHTVFKLHFDGIEIFLGNDMLYGPGKAANAGGVATSGLEMSQNSLRLSWSREEVDQKLHGIMKSIHKAAYETSVEYGQPGNYPLGANIAGFMKVAKAMLASGVV